MIEICEVGPRDGIQNEKILLTTAEKLEFIGKLIAAGAKKIEVTSFVNARVVPQMADAEQLIQRLPLHDDISYSALVLSRSGLNRLIETPINHVQLSFAVSDGFNLKNVKRTTEQSVIEMLDIVKEAKQLKRFVNVILGTSYGCPYDGDVDIQSVMSIAEKFIAIGVDEITLADTVGLATPNKIEQSIQLFKKRFGDFPIGLHLHNTRGLGIANALAGLQNGVTKFDASVGGIGGCPFAPKAVGNICTEDFVYMLHKMGYETSINLDQYIDVAKWIESKLQRKIDGMLMKTI